MTPRPLTSPLLTAAGVPHAFSTREGGVSFSPFDSLNFGNPSDLPAERRDPSANIRRNFEILLNTIGAAGRRVVQVHQVHGRAVHAASQRSSGDDKADAIVADDPSLLACVRVADCCPVLLSSADGRVVAAAHAGWRGVIAGVAGAALEAMQRRGARGIVAAIGPCIGVDRFEIGPEVAAEFRRVFGERAPLRPGAAGKFHADLKTALRLQLADAGVENVDVLDRCTFAEPDLFFSHRRDSGVTGRMVGVIGPRRVL